ncbi:hypothetical protein GEV33_008345 [Tenebrio molitor]|uniref:DUF4817 domain-containing protein n=1 Tax=Tenebrio molitor TaxID=7067 RepID=A0A8J6LAY1_TENMO|nr:hypothetical protein GEV33_008345 [Tenebrio molitor]
MVQYTNPELTDMVLIYGEALTNAGAARRLYMERFPGRQNGLSDPDFRYRPRQFGERRGKYIKVQQTPFWRFSTSRGQRLRPILCNRCWRTRGGGPNRLGNRPRGIPTETSRRIKASFTRVIDPTLQRINFTTLLGRRHPQGSHQRTGPHTGLYLAEEPESKSNSYLARKGRGEEGPRGLSEDTDGVIDQRRKKDSEDLPPALSSRDSFWILSPRPGHLRNYGTFSPVNRNRGRSRSRRVLDLEPEILQAVEEEPNMKQDLLEMEFSIPIIPTSGQKKIHTKSENVVSNNYRLSCGQNGLSDPDFRYRPRQVGERRGKRYKGGTDAMKKVLDRALDRFSTSAGQRLRPILCNRSWRTRGGRPNRLENHLRRIPTETPRRIKASFTRVNDPTHKRSNFVTLLDRRHPQGPLRRAGPHTGLSLAEEPESRSNTYLARSSSVFLLPGVTSPETTRSLGLNFFHFFTGAQGLTVHVFLWEGSRGGRTRGLSEDTGGVIDQRRKKDSEDLPPAPFFPGLIF